MNKKELVNTVFRNNPRAVEDTARFSMAIDFLVGELVKETKGKIESKTAIKLVTDKLEEIKAVAWFKREFPTIFAYINDLALFGADSKNVFPIIKNELVKFREMFKDD